jgi:hypothetical protein
MDNDVNVNFETTIEIYKGNTSISQKLFLNRTPTNPKILFKIDILSFISLKCFFTSKEIIIRRVPTVW